MFRHPRNDDYDHYEYQGAFHMSGFENHTSADEEPSLMELMKSVIRTQSAVNEAWDKQIEVLNEKFDEGLRSQQETLNRLDEQINIFDDQNVMSSWYDEDYSKSEWENEDYKYDEIGNLEIVNPIVEEFEGDTEEEDKYEMEEVLSKKDEESKSQVIVTEPVPTPDVIDTTYELLSTDNPLTNTNGEVMVDDDLEYVSTVIDKSGCGVNIVWLGKPSEDLKCQVTEVDEKVLAEKEMVEEMHENQAEEALSDEDRELRELLEVDGEVFNEESSCDYGNMTIKELEEMLDLSNDLTLSEDDRFEETELDTSTGIGACIENTSTDLELNPHSELLEIATPLVKPFKIELKEVFTNFHHSHLQDMSDIPVILFSILTCRERKKFLQDTNEILLLRETREWHDAWVKFNRALNVGDEICSFEECLSNA